MAGNELDGGAFSALPGLFCSLSQAWAPGSLPRDEGEAVHARSKGPSAVFQSSLLFPFTPMVNALQFSYGFRLSEMRTSDLRLLPQSASPRACQKQ